MVLEVFRNKKWREKKKSKNGKFFFFFLPNFEMWNLQSSKENFNPKKIKNTWKKKKI